MSPIPQVIY